MRAAALASILVAAAAAAVPAAAQPLEQRFAFGAPPGVLGNDRPRLAPRKRAGGAVAVRLAEPHRAAPRRHARARHLR